MTGSGWEAGAMRDKQNISNLFIRLEQVNQKRWRLYLHNQSMIFFIFNKIYQCLEISLSQLCENMFNTLL